MKKSHHIPPQKAEKLLQWFLRDELAEEVLGDLEEKFIVMLEQHSPFRAKLNYWYQVLNYLRPFAIKKSRSYYPTQIDMYNHYFKLSWRNLLKKRLYSFINIGGLAIGISCFLIISLFVQHELSYDHNYVKADQIYRIIQQQKGNTYLGTDLFAVTPAPLAATLKHDYPEVLEATCIRMEEVLMSHEGKYSWEKGIAADEHYFRVFQSRFVEGNAASALLQPNSIVLTEKTARKIFGKTQAIGQSIIIGNADSEDDREVYLVTAIVEDQPLNVSIKYDFVLSIKSNFYWQRQAWDNNSSHTFFLMQKGADPQKLEEKLPEFLTKYRPKDESYPSKDKYLIKSLSSLHLQSAVNFDIGLKGNLQYVYLFSAIALIILLLACINYMNLAIARSINRAKEVGMRKVIGARRKQLVAQFLSESVLVALFGLALAIMLTYAFLPWFGMWVERPLALDFTQNKWLIPALISLVFFVGLISGSYPALFMSSLMPVHVLKGKIQTKFSGLRIQRALIVGQYVISTGLIMASMIIYLQLKFMQDKELGYEKDHILAVEITDNAIFDKYNTVKAEWLTHPQIEAVSASSSLPTHVRSSGIANYNNGDPDDDVAIYRLRADFDFLDVYDIKVLEGRNLSPEYALDSTDNCLINESAARALGWTPKEAIGQTFDIDGKKNVVGVIKNFHMHSMRLSIKPLYINLNRYFIRYFAVKVRSGRLDETIAFLQNSMATYTPYPFEYKFLDEHFNQHYKEDVSMGEIFGVFTLLALIIASLGLFGLAAFATEQRIKEIGIRKVLGASISQILILLCRDFLKLVAIAFLIAIPLAWYGMNNWLQEFAYRIDIPWWVFLATLFIIILISMFTISYQSVRAATANPAHSLRSE